MYIQLVCVACLVAKRVSQDDEARLSLLLQKFSREWSLLTSVTWDSVGGAFADAVYGGNGSAKYFNTFIFHSRSNLFRNPIAVSVNCEP